MEEVLKVINQKFVTLDNKEVASNNRQLKCVLDKMISLMKVEDPLFEAIYEKTFYGGSYYDDLKVGEPDEFDLDLLLVVPKLCDTQKIRTCGCVSVTTSNKPGFVWFKIDEDHNKPFNKFIENGYMKTDLVLNWLKGLVTRVLNKFNVDPSLYGFSFGTPRFSTASGPALTLRLYGEFGTIDVDLVPAFKFGPEHWPQKPFRANPSTKKTDFFIVPKKATDVNKSERYWRLSFQEQERELIKGKQRLKPALRLLKKMRNNLIHSSISSYALKTMVLWEVDASSFNGNETLSSTFMNLLKKYRESLNNQNIPYYWNKSGNLLNGIREDTLTNHYNEINRKIRVIEQNCERDPLVVAKIILKEGTEEYRLFIEYYTKPQTLPDLGQLQPSYQPTDVDQQTTSNWNNWATIGIVLGAGIAIGSGILGAIGRNNRNNNN